MWQRAFPGNHCQGKMIHFCVYLGKVYYYVHRSIWHVSSKSILGRHDKKISMKKKVWISPILRWYTPIGISKHLLIMYLNWYLFQEGLPLVCSTTKNGYKFMLILSILRLCCIQYLQFNADVKHRGHLTA